MRLRGRQRGVALAMLLWFIAALSLLVAGLMGLSRAEVSGVRLYLMQAQAGAVGDGVALLVAGGLVQKAPGLASTLQGELRFDDYDTTVRVIPVSGLVDVLSAGPELLAQAFAAANLEASETRALSDSVIEWRTSAETQERRRQVAQEVYVLEDIMAVPGLTREIFERLKWVVCAGCNNGGFNAQYASAELQTALEDTVWAAASAPSQDSSAEVDLRLQLPSAARVDVRIALDDGSVLQRSVWVSADGKLGRRYRAFRVTQLRFESDGIVQ
ncbi:hypothetical protein [Gilvimarinus polysaccharolyticus]|uniref:hypothetical protein n=1 Tax=Gilvimarinus polysaccharolyticus TaxID=863921 RepID=UPI0006736EC3|nr:hypothetical protein [Gilvimarinus polysaccharolyticus]